MTASETLIRGAMARCEARGGMRTRVRLSSELKRRATACAKAVGDNLVDWVNAACRNMKRGKFDGVAFEDKTLDATREGSEAVWVRAPHGMNGAQIRLAVACAVRVAEEKALPAFECQLVEGRDYLVEDEA